MQYFAQMLAVFLFILAFPLGYGIHVLAVALFLFLAYLWASYKKQLDNVKKLNEIKNIEETKNKEVELLTESRRREKEWIEKVKQKHSDESDITAKKN